MLKLRALMPDKLCLRCDVCCRFPDKDSVYAPLFLPQEINLEIKPCLDKSGRAKLIGPGDTYTCPFFNTKNNKCSIYDKRPFDCRLYPFTITFDETRENIILGMDAKCPFIADKKNEQLLKNHSKYILKILEEKKISSLIAENPLFVGNLDSEIIKISILETLTKMLLKDPVKRNFKKLELKDKPVFDRFFKKFERPLSCQSFVNLYIWKEPHETWWKKTENSIEILAESSSDFVPFDSIKRFPDYTYLQKDLAELKGDGYKHKRASCNYFIKHYKFQYLPFNKNIKEECLALFKKWRSGKKKKHKEPYYRQLLEDSYETHKIAMENYKALGLEGRVIKIKGRVSSYTFGFRLSKDTFCILFEISDPAFKGISQFIFREFCRELTGFKYINTMDDSGLENLKSTKLSYHPIQLI